MDKLYKFITATLWKKLKVVEWSLQKTVLKYFCYLKTTKQPDGDPDPGVGVVRHVAVRAAADLLHQVPGGGEEEERGADGVSHYVVVILEQDKIED